MCDRSEANIVEDGLRAVANSITPTASAPYQDGPYEVGSLTESIIHLARAADGIAQAIQNLANAVGDMNN